MALLVRHCFPDFWDHLASIEEPRHPDRIRYPLTQVLSLATFMFACRITSRRELDRVSDNACFVENLCRFSGTETETVMVSGQMVNVFKDLDADELAGVQPKLIRTLVKDKRLQDAYVLGHLAVCSDGTGIFASSNDHCDECLTQKHKDGTVTYMHNMLEAKILCANGMALSLMSEPIKNPSCGSYEKQHCETKAFKRIAPRIKDEFPRQPFVHLLDSLYAQGRPQTGIAPHANSSCQNPNLTHAVEKTGIVADSDPPPETPFLDCALELYKTPLATSAPNARP